MYKFDAGLVNENPKGLCVAAAIQNNKSEREGGGEGARVLPTGKWKDEFPRNTQSRIGRVMTFEDGKLFVCVLITGLMSQHYSNTK